MSDENEQMAKKKKKKMILHLMGEIVEATMTGSR